MKEIHLKIFLHGKVLQQDKKKKKKKLICFLYQKEKRQEEALLLLVTNVIFSEVICLSLFTKGSRKLSLALSYILTKLSLIIYNKH